MRPFMLLESFCPAPLPLTEVRGLLTWFCESACNPECPNHRNDRCIPSCAPSPSTNPLASHRSARFVDLVSLVGSPSVQDTPKSTSHLMRSRRSAFQCASEPKSSCTPSCVPPRPFVDPVDTEASSTSSERPSWPLLTTSQHHPKIMLLDLPH